VKLRAIPQKAFQKCFQNQKKCWEQCTGVEETTSKGTRLNNSQVNEIVLLKNSGNFPDSPHVLFMQWSETKVVTSPPPQLHTDYCGTEPRLCSEKPVINYPPATNTYNVHHTV